MTSSGRTAPHWHELGSIRRGAHGVAVYSEQLHNHLKRGYIVFHTRMALAGAAPRET